MSRPSSSQDIVDLARRQGWRSRRTKAGWMLYPPDRSKAPIAVHMTISDHRGVDNLYSHMLRSGLRKESSNGVE